MRCLGGEYNAEARQYDCDDEQRASRTRRTADVGSHMADAKTRAQPSPSTGIAWVILVVSSGRLAHALFTLRPETRWSGGLVWHSAVSLAPV